MRRIRSPGQGPAASLGVKFRDSSPPGRAPRPSCSSPPRLGAPAGEARAARWPQLRVHLQGPGPPSREPSTPFPVPARAPTLLNAESAHRMPCWDWGLPPSPVLGWQGRAETAGAGNAQGIADLEATEGCACAKNNTHTHTR